MAAVIANASVMSGTGERAKVETPTVVAVVKPATDPLSWWPNNRVPSQAVTRTTPSPPRADGNAAVRCVTTPLGIETIAISQA